MPTVSTHFLSSPARTKHKGVEGNPRERTPVDSTRFIIPVASSPLSQVWLRWFYQNQHRWYPTEMANVSTFFYWSHSRLLILILSGTAKTPGLAPGKMLFKKPSAQWQWIPSITYARDGRCNPKVHLGSTGVNTDSSTQVWRADILIGTTAERSSRCTFPLDG